MRGRLRIIFVVCGSALATVYVAAAGFGGGGRGYFSPDTLDCRTHAEWLVPLTRFPVYRGPSSTHRYPVVDYLVARGFWSASDRPAPRWLPTFRWNAQWKGGHSTFHYEMGRRGDDWVAWSDANPATAAALWPMVLAALRSPGVTGTRDASDLMLAARLAKSVEEFEKQAHQLAAVRTKG
jgi:hypothetical protein